MEKQESSKPAERNTRATRKPRSPEGLGDVVEAVTTATGIKAAVDWFSEQTGIDCGCDARKEKLNELFSFRKKVNCLSQEDYQTLSILFAYPVTKLTPVQQDVVATMHAKVFNHKFVRPCTCNPKKWMQWTKDLHDVYIQYKQDEA